MFFEYLPTGEEDYSGIGSILTVPRCVNRRCLSIDITNDQIVEKDEEIGIAITRSEHNRIRYDSTPSVITIHDNDRMSDFSNNCCRIILDV